MILTDMPLFISCFERESKVVKHGVTTWMPRLAQRQCLTKETDSSGDAISITAFVEACDKAGCPMRFVPDRAQAPRMFMQRNSLIEVIMFALVIKAEVEGDGQVAQVVITSNVPRGAQRHGFTKELYVLV